MSTDEKHIVSHFISKVVSLLLMQSSVFKTVSILSRRSQMLLTPEARNCFLQHPISKMTSLGAADTKFRQWPDSSGF